MTETRSRLTVLGVAPDVEELQQHQCTLLVPAVGEEDQELTTQAWRIELPDAAYATLATGRQVLQRLSTGWWSVTGEWAGEAFRADEIREGVDSLNRPECTLWRRDLALEQAQEAAAAAEAETPDGLARDELPPRVEEDNFPVVLDGEGPSLEDAQAQAFYLTLSPDDSHIDPYMDPDEWPTDPEAPWVQDPTYTGPGPAGSARFQVRLPEEAHAAVAAHIAAIGEQEPYHNWWLVTGAGTEEPYTFAAEELLHVQDYRGPAQVVWQSERMQVHLAQEAAELAESERAALSEGMQALGLSPDNPEAVAAYQEWLECDPTPYNPPGRAQSLAYERMMQFAAPAAEQQLVEEEWGDFPAAQRGEQAIERQRQLVTELE